MNTRRVYTVYFFTSISSKNIIPKTKRERERGEGRRGEKWERREDGKRGWVKPIYRSAQPSFKHLFQREQSVSKLRSEVAGCTGQAILSCETNFPEHPQPHGRALSPGDVNTTTGGKKNKNGDERREIALTSRLITLTGGVINRRRKKFREDRTIVTRESLSCIREV